MHKYIYEKNTLQLDDFSHNRLRKKLTHSKRKSADDMN